MGVSLVQTITLSNISRNEGQDAVDIKANVSPTKIHSYLLKTFQIKFILHLQTDSRHHLGLARLDQKIQVFVQTRYWKQIISLEVPEKERQRKRCSITPQNYKKLTTLLLLCSPHIYSWWVILNIFSAERWESTLCNFNLLNVFPMHGRGGKICTTVGRWHFIPLPFLWWWKWWNWKWWWQWYFYRKLWFLKNHHFDFFKTSIGHTVEVFHQRFSSIKLVTLLELPLRLYTTVEVAQNIAKSTFRFVATEFFMNGKLNCELRHGLWTSTIWSDNEGDKIGILNLQSSQQKWNFVSRERRQGDSREWCLKNQHSTEVKNWQIELLVRRSENSGAAASTSTSGGIGVIDVSQHRHHHHCHQRRHPRCKHQWLENI